MYKHLSLAALLAAAGIHAATHDVDVGESGLVFEPDTLTASPGDKINFHFYPGDHAVAESTFSSPCVPMSGSFFSGYFTQSAGEAKQMFTVTVSSTDPMWVYCPQVGHCSEGMAMVVNPPSSGSMSLAAYKKAAKGQSGKAPSKVGGGVLSPNEEGGSSSSSASSSSAMMSSSSMAASSSSSAMSSASSSSMMMSSSSASPSPSSSASAPATMSSSSAASSPSSTPPQSSPQASSSTAAQPQPPPNAAPVVGVPVIMAVGLGFITGAAALVFA